jgi:hypothetical protein
MVSEPSIAYQVTFVIGVLATVDFDDEPSLSANEVDDIWANGFLTHEFQAM